MKYDGSKTSNNDKASSNNFRQLKTITPYYYKVETSKRKKMKEI